MYDYVEVFDGHLPGAASLGRFCGHTRPPTITSSACRMTVKFVADGSISARGFSASYSSIDKGTNY